jgi:UDP-N-acetylglucosamine acyltransferase
MALSGRSQDRPVNIHPTSIVAAGAEIAAEARIGPFCVIAARVRIGPGTVVESHARIGSEFGEVVIGRDNHIQTGAALGGPAQDLGYRAAQDCRLVIGDGNRIGEYASIHLSSPKTGGSTQLGNRIFVMAYTHIAHDCEIADDVILTNGVQLGGHVCVGRRAMLGGGCSVTQFVRIGELCFATAGSYLNKDAPPYSIVDGRWATMRACNRVGLERAGLSPDAVRNIDRAVRLLRKSSLTVEEALTAITQQCQSGPEIERLQAFVRGSSKGLARA